MLFAVEDGDMEGRLVDEVTWDGQASGAYGDGGRSRDAESGAVDGAQSVQ